MLMLTFKYKEQQTKYQFSQIGFQLKAAQVNIHTTKNMGESQQYEKRTEAKG